MRMIAFFEIPLGKLDEYIETWNSRIPQDASIKIIVPPHTLPEPCNGITGFVIFENPLFSMKVVEDFLEQFTKLGGKVTLRFAWEDKTLAKELHEYNSGKVTAEREWTQRQYERLSDFGATTRLSVLPLIDWHTAREDLLVELGVAYLIETDEMTILFDVGLNAKQMDPSPLLQNMKRLGVSLDEIDAIVISHNHGDHTGGSKWSEKMTFSLTAKQIDLTGKQVYTPVRMKYPGLKLIHAKDPTVIGNGVTTIGAICHEMFFSDGFVYEQALAVNVKDKGIVLIVGCGHQGLPKIIKRSEMLFTEPIYGLLGGLHYPVEGGPREICGMNPYKYLGTGKVPWDYWTEQEVQQNLQLLKSHKPGIVGISPHDSSAFSIALLRKTFPEAFRAIKVGQKITF